VRALALVAALAAGAAAAQSPNTAETEGEPVQEAAREGFGDWLAGFRTRALAAGVPEAVLEAALAGVTPDPKIVERDRRQAEFSKAIWDYLDTAVSEARVADGRRALAREAAALARIEADYGVDRHVVAAIWGLESSYGAFRGDTPTIAALATLAHDARRAAFFEGQLIAALRILATGEVAPGDLRGSWAGAMGHTQFMPGSWWEFAVDGTGDGRRDIWGEDPADALASTANYLRHWGWVAGQPWGLEVRLPQGFDYTQTTERVVKPVAEWREIGVVTAEGGALPVEGGASILLPAGHRGPAFLIFPNFRAIERYNTADAYVIAVGHLADRLRGGPPIRAAWPRDLRALTYDERVEMQRLLAARGFDPQGIDGRVGPRTIAAIQAWQQANGLVPDGFASPEVLERLR
jgi:membrane-bound lytic murein transglycosylase B